MPPIGIAIVRSLYGAVLLGAAAALGQLANGSSTRAVVISGLTAGVGYLILRGGVEGVIDQRASNAKGV